MAGVNSTEILLLALESITNDNLEILSAFLSKFPIENLDVSRSDVLLSQLLNACSKYNREEAAKLIIERWEDTYPSQEIDFFSTLFKNTLFNQDTYKFLATAFPKYSFLSVMSDLCRDDSAENLIRVMDNVFYAYGEQSTDRLEIIREEADSTGNWIVYNYIVDKLIPLAVTAPKPEWVKNFYSSETLPSQEELQALSEEILTQTANEDIPMPDEETLIGYLTDGMANAGLSFENIEEARSALRGILTQLSPEEIQELIGDRIGEVLKTGNLSTLQNNETLFRILGPSNPQINSTAPDFLDAQDRMFTCNLYDYDEDEDEYEPWFTGNCLTCMKKIEEYWYAIRLPRSQGGWSGCYCTFQCARQDLLNEEIPKLPDIAILDIVEKKIHEKGIQDRS